MKQFATDYLPTCHKFAKSRRKPKRSSKPKPSPSPACQCGVVVTSTTGLCWTCDDVAAEQRMADVREFTVMAQKRKAAEREQAAITQPPARNAADAKPERLIGILADRVRADIVNGRIK